MRISGLDHVVIYSNTIDRTIDFHTRVLSMTHVVFDDTCQALHLGDQKIKVHDAAQPFEPHAVAPRAGSFDVCLLTDSIVDDEDQGL